MVRAIERLIQLDEQETARQRERVASLALAAAVIEALPDALVVIDLSGAIVMINERTELLFGYLRSELIGRQVEMLLPAESRDLHAKNRIEYNQFTLSAHARTMGLGLQLSGVRSDGHVFPVDIMLARMVVPKGIYNLALVRHTPRQHGHELRVEYTVETDVKNDAVYAGR